MTDQQQQHRATPEQWELLKRQGQTLGSAESIALLELRDRIAALEASASIGQAVTPANTSTPAGSLVERVEESIMQEDWMNNGLDESVCGDDDPNYRYTSAACNSGHSFHTLQSRAAIRTVADWLRRGHMLHAAELLDQEANR
jgi:hypothetical protein